MICAKIKKQKGEMIFAVSDNFPRRDNFVYFAVHASFAAGVCFIFCRRNR